MNDTRSPSEEDLHAYVDGALDDADQAWVERFLAENPETAAMVADWQAQNAALRAAFEPAAISHVGDANLLRQFSPERRSTPSRAALAAAAIVVFTAGALGGHYLPPLLAPSPVQMAEADMLPAQARDAFLVYASEVRHPVEVFANDEAHLATWLGKRLGMTNLKVPDLQATGFHLVGGRLLPVAGEAGAMFMYENATGERLTVLIGRNRTNRDTSFRFASAGDLETFYWIDGEIGCAVSGEISRETLRRVADAVYRQLPV